MGQEPEAKQPMAAACLPCLACCQANCLPAMPRTHHASHALHRCAWACCTQAELRQVAEQLRQSTKQLCRNLKDNPNVAENMAKVLGWSRSLGPGWGVRVPGCHAQLPAFKCLLHAWYAWGVTHTERPWSLPEPRACGGRGTWGS